MKLKSGATYKNRLGAVIVVDSLYLGNRPATLGDIWEAHAPDNLFGSRPYLVTPASMKDSGYVEVEQDGDDDE